MKINLIDITFLILVRLDSVQRLENILTVTRALIKHFDTNIYVLEAAPYNNGLLEKLLNRKIIFKFIEDKDNILYKTKYYNALSRLVTTPYMGIWDTDIVIDKKAIIDSVSHLRNGADAVFPYNGWCYEIPEIVKRLYFARKDIRLLYRHIEKLNLLYDKTLYGGGVFVNVARHLQAGGDNEQIYGWGNDDFVRYERWKSSNFNIYRSMNPLFHLCHPRGQNSSYHSPIAKRISDAELKKATSL
jgi:hypothetical protein